MKTKFLPLVVHSSKLPVTRLLFASVAVITLVSFEIEEPISEEG